MADVTDLDRRAEEHAPATHAAPTHDPYAEPSAEWGWHGGFPRASRIGGWFVAAVLLLMLIGNHSGRVEDLWLIGLALVVIGVLVWDQMSRRTSWRR